MANRITINPEDVLSIAGRIASLNNQLDDTLKKTQQKVRSLSDSFIGEAGTATISNFEEFAQKYNENYKELINQYVKFLKDNVASLYPEIDKKIARLGDEVL